MCAGGDIQGPKNVPRRILVLSVVLSVLVTALTIVAVSKWIGSPAPVGSQFLIGESLKTRDPIVGVIATRLVIGIVRSDGVVYWDWAKQRAARLCAPFVVDEPLLPFANAFGPDPAGAWRWDVQAFYGATAGCGLVYLKLGSVWSDTLEVTPLSRDAFGAVKSRSEYREGWLRDFLTGQDP